MLLMRNRKDVDLHFADCGTGMVFIDGGSRQQVIMPDPETLNGMQPYLKAWMDRGTLSADMPTNSVILLEVAQPLADTVGRFTTTAPAGYAPDAPGGAGLAETPVRFGGNITFLGYERGSAAPFPPGGIVTTITYWRVDGAVPPDLRLFTHVLADPATAPAAQNDTISVDVRQLESRDVFIQIVFVPLPVAIPPGQYGISIGAYTAANNVRLPVMDDRLGARHARLIIASMRRVSDAQKVLAHAKGVPVLARVFEDHEAEAIRRLGGIPVSNSEAAVEQFMKWFQAGQKTAA